MSRQNKGYSSAASPLRSLWRAHKGHALLGVTQQSRRWGRPHTAAFAFVVCRKHICPSTKKPYKSAEKLY